MKYTFAFGMAAAAMLSVLANAGTVSGKVSGVAGQSVVYLGAAAGTTFPASLKEAVVDQKDMVFLPVVQVVQLGTTVEFRNSDSVAHNVYWPSIGDNRKLGHNLGTWPQGEKRSFKFDNPGVVPLLCNVHPEMFAFIVVSPTPYFAMTDKFGAYAIKNVPDGVYTVVAWHEGARGPTKQVTVAGDSIVNIALQQIGR
jgi:plastocyanin